MKHIRELTMGPPKTWKTGRVAASYPRPLLLFEGDEGGQDIIPTPPHQILASTDTSNPLAEWCKKPTTSLPPISAVQFNVKEDATLTSLFKPAGDPKAFADFNKTVNNLFLIGCPWKTVVIDPVTVVQDMVLASFASSNAAKMEDAQKWAGAVGEKVKRILATIFTLPCHVVVIMHTAKKDIIDPATRQVKDTIQEPVIYGKVRNFIGSLPSQFFYQDSMVVAGRQEIFIKTVPDGKVEGIGVRWPAGLPAKIPNPTFQAIYGDAVKRGETYG